MEVYGGNSSLFVHEGMMWAIWSVKLIDFLSAANPDLAGDEIAGWCMECLLITARSETPEAKVRRVVCDCVWGIGML